MPYDDVIFSLRTMAGQYSLDDRDENRGRILRSRIWEYFEKIYIEKYKEKVRDQSYLQYTDPLLYASDNEDMDFDEVFGDIPEQILHCVGSFPERDYKGSCASFQNRKTLQEYVCNGVHWYDIYDFVEALYKVLGVNLPDDFTKDINTILAACLSRYRFIDGHITRMLDDDEMKEISKAMQQSANISKHIETAVSEYGRRIDANMNKVVSSAVLAVESCVVESVEKKKDTLGQALDYYQKHCSKNARLDDKLVQAIKAFYKYTCQSGIRHGGSDYPCLDEAEARMSLVIASALTNFLVERNQVLGVVGSEECLPPE